MKLKNDFKDEDKGRVWGQHPFCALCQSNQGCAVHHIDSRSSSSIYNGVLLCHDCHKEADGHNTDSPLSEAFRRGLRAISYAMVKKSGHIENQNDKDYLEKHKICSG